MASTALYIGMYGGGSGTYNLSGGTLATHQISGGTGTSTFNFNGGLLQAGSGAANSPYQRTDQRLREGRWG